MPHITNSQAGTNLYDPVHKSIFEVYFTLPGDKAEKTYNYGFCIDKEGVTEEWLNSKAKTARKYSPVFYRNAEELDLSGFPKSSRDNIHVALEKQVLIISLGAKLKIGKCKDIRDWFLANERYHRMGDDDHAICCRTFLR